MRTPEDSEIVEIDVSREMESSFLEYAYSVCCRGWTKTRCVRAFTPTPPLPLWTPQDAASPCPVI